MKRAALVLLVVPLIALWLAACDGESPSAPETVPETAALFGKKTIPIDEQTECYKAGLAALEAAEAYGETAKDLAKCDQGAQGPCDEDQQNHADAWTALMAEYDAAVTACGGGTPPTGDQDGDGVLDAADSCPTGETGWTSDGSTDFDGDGCRDADEDLDDDNDGVLDVGDDCPLQPGSADYNGCPGVCTEDSQCGVCQVCAVDGDVPACLDAALGEDPKNECGPGYCDGAGSCTAIGNTPPWISGVNITPPNPTTATTSLLCSADQYGDPDAGDFVTLSYAWFVNSAVLPTEVGSSLSSSHYSLGDQVDCAITADDTHDQTTEPSQTVTIGEAGNDPLANLVISEIYPNPPGVDAIIGEYVEIYNPTPNAITLDGIDLETGTAPSYSIIAQLSGSVPAGGYCVVSNVELVILPDGGTYTPCIHSPGAASLSNLGSSVRLHGAYGGHEVTYPDFSQPPESGGLSWAYDPGFDPTLDGAWCPQDPTPGEVNLAWCGDEFPIP